MASYNYPTPPPTNSPKRHTSSFHQESYDPYNPTNISSQATYQSYEPPTQMQSYPSEQSKLPAQDSYFNTEHSPLIPRDPAFPPQNQSRPQPERRRSSPGPSPYTHPFSPRLRATATASPPPRRRSPGNPNYYTTSPLPAITPYNGNRPKPRPGFLARIKAKIVSLIRAFMRWSKRNPITAGILTFVPFLTIAGIAKVTRVVGKGFGFIESGGFKKSPKKAVDGDKGILDDFSNFGGSKGGPLDGMLKVLQMLV